MPGPIPPGEEGIIKIKLNTANKGGRTVDKKITVFTNDPENERLYIDMKVKVDRLYKLSHRRVNLVGNVGVALKQTVTLTPEKDHAFKVKEVTAKRGDHINYQLHDISNQTETKYELTIENTKKEAGPYFDTLYLKTDSTVQPEIKIQVFGNIRKPTEVKEKQLSKLKEK